MAGLEASTGTASSAGLARAWRVFREMDNLNSIN